MDGYLGLFLIFGVAAIVVLALISIYNGLVRSRNQVEAAWGQIDIQLKRRHDLIPNLVEVTKDAMSYEQETLEAVIKARNVAVQASDGPRNDSISAEALLGAATSKLLAIVEDYPDLKANQTIMQLSEELRSTENRIAFARQHYNDSVESLNNKTETFPSNIVASSFGFSRATYFVVPDSEKENIAVDLR